MNNKDHSADGVLILMKVLSKKWMLLLFHEFILKNELRFNEIKDGLPGISSKMLSQRLSDLEDLGFIERKIINQKPIVIKYIAKEKIKDTLPLFESLFKWSQKWDIVHK